GGSAHHPAPAPRPVTGRASPPSPLRPPARTRPPRPPPPVPASPGAEVQPPEVDDTHRTAPSPAAAACALADCTDQPEPICPAWQLIEIFRQFARRRSFSCIGRLRFALGR